MILKYVLSQDTTSPSKWTIIIT